jgi:N-acetylglutamate synthase-like GNAT family acetyltransferase
MTSVSFRAARLDDLAAIVALLADDDLGKAREQAGATVSTEYVRAFAEIERSHDNTLIVAEADGRVAGCLQLTIIPGLSRQGARRALIESVRVASWTRGQGLGAQMMQHAIDEARRAGCRIVQLTSDKRRTGAHAFFKSLGFAATHEGFKLELEP